MAARPNACEQAVLPPLTPLLRRRPRLRPPHPRLPQRRHQRRQHQHLLCPLRLGRVLRWRPCASCDQPQGGRRRTGAPWPAWQCIGWLGRTAAWTVATPRTTREARGVTTRTPYVQHARHAPSTIPHHPVAASAQDQPATRAQGTCAVSCSEVGAQPSRRHAIAIRVSAVSGMKLPTATLHPPSSVASRPCRDTAHPWACPAYGRCCLIDQCPMFPGTAACRSPSLQVFNTVVTNTTQHNTPGQHGRAWTHRQKYTPRSTDLPVLSSSCRYQGDHMVRE